MTDFNTPTNTSTYSAVLSTLNSKISSVAKMLFTSDTNLPTSAIQYNRTNRVLEEWNGTTWDEKRIEPPGVIKAYAGSAAPRGHLLCDGAAVSRTTYADLFAAIGTTYGAGNGTSTFNVPNLKGRFPLGKSDSGTGSTLASTGGTIDHTHTVPAHYHGLGTGATLAVDIAHNHSSSSVTGTVGGSDGTHSHTITDPGHSHTYDRRSSASAFGNALVAATPNTTGTAGQLGTSADVTGITINTTSSGHGHSHSLSAAGQTLGATSKTPTGLVGLVTGGVDGNAAMTSGSTNPPFQVVNYIITV